MNILGYWAFRPLYVWWKRTVEYHNNTNYSLEVRINGWRLSGIVLKDFQTACRKISIYYHRNNFSLVVNRK